VLASVAYSITVFVMVSTTWPVCRRSGSRCHLSLRLHWAAAVTVPARVAGGILTAAEGEVWLQRLVPPGEGTA
jgi:hypothetical protein